jgi:molecular chaperone HscB
MSSSTPASTLQVCRECGAGAPLDVHFCPQCRKILPLGRQGDYFAFLGVPRKLNLDAADLERRFRDLSRQFHPDYFYNAAPSERRASLERSSHLNDAYRTLKNPIARVEYLLEIEGLKPREGGQMEREGVTRAAVPPDLLEEVFALNEELEEVRDQRASGAPAERWKAQLERARRPIEAKRDEHESQLRSLAARWDALVDAPVGEAERRPVLEALRDRVLERNYINNLLASIDREAGS